MGTGTSPAVDGVRLLAGYTGTAAGCTFPYCHWMTIMTINEIGRAMIIGSTAVYGEPRITPILKSGWQRPR